MDEMHTGEIFFFPAATLLYIWPSKRKHDDGSNSDSAKFVLYLQLHVFLLPCICITCLVEALKDHPIETWQWPFLTAVARVENPSTECRRIRWTDPWRRLLHQCLPVLFAHLQSDSMRTCRKLLTVKTMLWQLVSVMKSPNLRTDRQGSFWEAETRACCDWERTVWTRKSKSLTF